MRLFLLEIKYIAHGHFLGRWHLSTKCFKLVVRFFRWKLFLRFFGGKFFAQRDDAYRLGWFHNSGVFFGGFVVVEDVAVGDNCAAVADAIRWNPFLGENLRLVVCTLFERDSE